MAVVLNNAVWHMSIPPYIAMALCMLSCSALDAIPTYYFIIIIMVFTG